MTRHAPRNDAATEAVETSMYRALAVLRVVVLLNTLGLAALNWEDMAQPAVAAAGLVVITAWTAVAVWGYDDPKRRRAPLLLTDLAIAVGVVLLSLPAKGAELDSTLPGFWVMGVLLAWGIHWHWVGGLAAAAALSLADVSVRTDLNETNYGNIFLIMVGGPVLGYTSGLLKEMAAARDRAEHEAAVAAERARLARAVHDGVLQVLALVQRRGAELGGEAADLGRLAGEQEVALRALVQGLEAPSDASADPGDPLGGTVDLAQALRGVSGSRVTVSVPGTPVEVGAGMAGEVVAAVRACLDNVGRHAGDAAQAWVLLEDLGSQVVVSVRDEGPGIPAGRLDQAAAEGRLGVSQSIRGRVEDLGGTATLVTASGQGTEWELTFPREGAPA